MATRATRTTIIRSKMDWCWFISRTSCGVPIWDSEMEVDVVWQSESGKFRTADFKPGICRGTRQYIETNGDTDLVFLGKFEVDVFRDMRCPNGCQINRFSGSSSLGKRTVSGGGK